MRLPPELSSRKLACPSQVSEPATVRFFQRNVRLCGEPFAMGRGALVTPALVLAAGLGVAAHAPSFAFYLLLAAVLSAAVSALSAFGDVISEGATPLAGVQAVLRGLGLVFALTASAVLAPARGDHAAPRLAVSALVACLIVLAVEALVTGVAAAAQRRTGHEPASAPR